MKLFKNDFLQTNKKKMTTGVVAIISILLLMCGLLLLFAFLTNDSNHILFHILSTLIAIIGGSSIIFISLEIIKESYKNIYFYKFINNQKVIIYEGKIVSKGTTITLQKGIKAIEYNLLTEGKTIKVYLNIEIQDYVFDVDEEGVFKTANNFVIEYEKK